MSPNWKMGVVGEEERRERRKEESSYTTLLDKVGVCKTY